MNSFFASSAKNYFRYLRKKNKGVEYLKAKSRKKLSDNSYILVFAEKITKIDFLRHIVIDDKKYAPELFELFIYGTNSVHITIPAELTDTFSIAEEISFVIDFTILTLRMQRAYEKASLLSIPVYSSVTDVVMNELSTLEKSVCFSSEQITAVRTILSNPVSYIWGTAGSGKTRFVLAYSAIALLKANPSARVMITAPTNVAVENAMKAIIPIAEQHGIPRSEIWRSGTPSSEFSKEFPECCINIDIIQKRSVLNRKVKALDRYLKISDAISDYSDTLTDISSFYENDRSIETLKAKLNDLTLELNLAEGNRRSANTHLLYINNEINRLKREKRMFFKSIKRFITGKNAELEERLNELYQLLTETNSILSGHCENIISIEQKIKEKECEIKKLTDDNRKISDEILKTLKKYGNSVSSNDFDRIAQRIKLFASERIEELSKIRAEYEQEIDFENDNRVREAFEKAEKDLDKLTLKMQGSNARLVGETIDFFAANIDNPHKDKNFSHIFLDEAYYASIGKTGILFSLNCPITFLGDHMQLPPVTELNDIDIRTHGMENLFIWSMSGIYTADLLNKSPQLLYEMHLSGKPFKPEFPAMATLTATHRYGENLARALDKYIYNTGFHSVSQSETSIFIIDVPRIIPPKNKRENESEANAIKTFLKKNNIEDYIVLAPYKNQVKLITSTLDSDEKSNVLTIHKSQGQEWDNVLISITDTHDMYYTNIQNIASQGKQVLNTAISRAKKNLFLFCDIGYWRGKPNQLLSELIDIGKIIRM